MVEDKEKEKKGKRVGFEARIRRMWTWWMRFVEDDLWTLQKGDLSGRQWPVVRALRIVLIAVRRSLENSVQVRASALTYYTLMSLVPMVALAFGLARGFGLEEALHRVVSEQLADYPDLVDRIIGFADRLLARTGRGVVAGVGVAVLFWTVVKVFTNIEKSFNAIWQVGESRSMLRRFSDYLSMIVMLPIVLIAASSANVVLKTHLQAASEEAGIINALSPMLLFMLRTLPSLLVTLVFCLLYAVMPNAKVKVVPATIAGLVAGVGFVGLQWGYFTFQVGVSKYNAIYGSLAAIPLLLVWMQLSWLVILFGAELSYAIQNVQLYESEGRYSDLKPRQMKELSLLLMISIAERFVKGKPAYTSEELSKKHSLPLRLTNRLLNWMQGANLVVLVELSDASEGWQPQRSLDYYTVRGVFDSYDEYGQSIEWRDGNRERIEELYELYRESGKSAEIPLRTLGSHGEEG